jgi:hypothetical protein
MGYGLTATDNNGRMTMYDMADDPNIKRNVYKATDASLQLAKIAIDSSDHIPGKIAMALAAMTGPLAAIALLTAKDSDNLKDENFVFASIVAHQALRPAADNSNSVTLDVRPSMWVDAVVEFRKAGHDPAAFLAEGMMDAVRQMESESAAPLQAFLEMRATKGDRLN